MAFTCPSPKLPCAGTHTASHRPCLPFPSRLTCFGLESSPSRLDFRSWKEKKAWIGPQQGWAQGRAGQGEGAAGHVLLPVGHLLAARRTVLPALALARAATASHLLSALRVQWCRAAPRPFQDE